MSDAARPRSIPIHSSLLRPNLLAGGERTLTLLNMTLASVMIFGIGTLPAIAAGLVTGAVIQWMLTLMAKRDPQAFDTYRRHIHQQKFYPAAAWVDATRSPPRE